jgi:hypothetical protein
MQVLPYTIDRLSWRFTKACAQRINRAIVLGRNLHRSLCVLELRYSLVSARLEGAMDTKLYLTIGAVAAILYALAFLLFPVNASLFFSDFAEARAVLYLRFCGAAILAWGLIVWFARDFQGWYAVRSVLIASVVGLAINIIITVWATVAGWLNGRAWGSTVVLVLLLVGAAYQLVVRRLEDR